MSTRKFQEKEPRSHGHGDNNRWSTWTKNCKLRKECPSTSGLPLTLLKEAGGERKRKEEGAETGPYPDLQRAFVSLAKRLTNGRYDF
ncbi:hypothetical protein AAC387_Pa08g2175 [Persea americana]